MAATYLDQIVAGHRRAARADRRSRAPLITAGR